MASIQERTSAAKGTTYQVKWRHDGRQQAVTVDLKRDATMLVRWLDKFGTRPSDDADLLRALGRTPAPKDMPDVVTVKAALEAFAARDHLSARTVAVYQNHTGLFDSLHDLSVHRVTPQDVRAAMADVHSRVGTATASNAAVTLAGALRPYGGAPLLKGHYSTATALVRDREPYALSVEQIERLVKIGHSHGIGDLMALAAATGARFGELIALRGEHGEGLDGPRPQLFIREQILKGTRQPTTTLKTRSSRRRVPISRAVATWVADQGPGLLNTHDKQPGACWNHETPRWRLREKVVPQAIAEGVIVRPVKFHDFRHSFGANLLASGRVDIVAVSKWMGHANPGITGTTYGHVTEQALQAVYDVLG
jgi:integrase